MPTIQAMTRGAKIAMMKRVKMKGKGKGKKTMQTEPTTMTMTARMAAMVAVMVAAVPNPLILITMKNVIDIPIFSWPFLSMASSQGYTASGNSNVFR